MSLKYSIHWPENIVTNIGGYWTIKALTTIQDIRVLSQSVANTHIIQYCVKIRSQIPVCMYIKQLAMFKVTWVCNE